jgi:hypothetical protein
MKKVLMLFLLFSLFGCNEKIQKSLSSVHEKSKSKILSQSISDNNDKEKSSLTVLAINEHNQDTLKCARLHYNNCMDKFEEGEQDGSLLDYITTVKKLIGGYYNIEITYLGYQTLKSDSLFIEKGKNLFLKVALSEKSQ